MNKGALFLGLAIVFEVFGTTMLKLSEGFTVLLPSIGFIASYLAAFAFLRFSLQSIPLSTAYAIWTGLGTAFTVAVGVVLFQEDVSFIKILAIALVIVGVVMLNKSQEADYHHTRAEIH